MTLYFETLPARFEDHDRQCERNAGDKPPFVGDHKLDDVIDFHDIEFSLFKNHLA